MAASKPRDECPFALLYQGLPAVYDGEFMETEGRCAWTLRLPDAQPRMNSAVSACVFLREGFTWGSKEKKTAPVFAKALPVRSDYQSVPFKHVGVSTVVARGFLNGSCSGFEFIFALRRTSPLRSAVYFLMLAPIACRAIFVCTPQSKLPTCHLAACSRRAGAAVSRLLSPRRRRHIHKPSRQSVQLAAVSAVRAPAARSSHPPPETNSTHMLTQPAVFSMAFHFSQVDVDIF